MRGWSDVGLWVALCFLANISLHRPTCKTTFARLTQSQTISQSFHVFHHFQINERYSAFRNFFPKLCLILKNRFLVRLSSNFQERLFMPSSSPEFLLWWGYFWSNGGIQVFSSVSMETFNIQLVFQKLCLIITHWFLARFYSNFQEKLLMPSSYPNLLFVWLFLV